MLIATPVIGRELRQQSRRTAGSWVRVLAAALAGLAAMAILSSTTGGRIGGSLPGQMLFNTLSVVAFVFCLCEGVRQTSDCLSSEKRDGTLGLLLLTDLRSLDVVLGKLAATSIGSFYVLMAIFPTLAVALPYGGVTGGEFWRMQLVLLVTLFLGLTSGMWASSRHREAGRALMAGLALALGLVLVPLLLEIFLKRGPLPSISPAVAFQLAGDLAYKTAPLRFWLTTLAVLGVSWGLLALAGRRMAEAWQDEERPTTLQALQDQAAPQNQARWAPEGEPVWSEDLETCWQTRTLEERPDRQLIDVDPARWLAAWVPQHRFLAGLSVVLLTFGMFAGTFLTLLVGPMLVGLSGIWISAILPWVLLAYVASRPLAEARRAGSLELLLSTPLDPAAIVASHWRALWLQMARPVKVCAFLVGGVLLFWLAILFTAGAADSTMPFGLQLLTAVSRVLTGIAICRMGFYFSLKTRTLFGAMALTLLWSVIVPWILQVLAAMVGGTFYAGARMTGLSFNFWVVSFGAGFAGIIYSVLAARWAKEKLVEQFREFASRG